MNKKRIWISADHGMAVIYFLQSGLITALIKAGVEVVLLTDDSLVKKIKTTFSRKGMRVEGLLFKQAREYEKFQHERQWWLNFIRRVGGSSRINIAAQSSYIRQVAVEESNRRRLFMPLAWLVIGCHAVSPSRYATGSVDFRTGIRLTYYDALFNRLPPDLVIASTPGWRYDRYLLRAAERQGYSHGGSHRGLGSAIQLWFTWCRGGLHYLLVGEQKKELVNGSDWHPNG